MVFYEVCVCVHAGQLLEDIRRDVESRLSPLRGEIIGSRLKTRDALDALYSKMVSYILQRSDVGSPADANHVNQAKGDNKLQ